MVVERTCPLHEMHPWCRVDVGEHEIHELHEMREMTALDVGLLSGNPWHEIGWKPHNAYKTNGLWRKMPLTWNASLMSGWCRVTWNTGNTGNARKCWNFPHVHVASEKSPRMCRTKSLMSGPNPWCRVDVGKHMKTWNTWNASLMSGWCRGTWKHEIHEMHPWWRVDVGEHENMNYMKCVLDVGGMSGHSNGSPPRRRGQGCPSPPPCHVGHILQAIFAPSLCKAKMNRRLSAAGR